MKRTLGRKTRYDDVKQWSKSKTWGCLRNGQPFPYRLSWTRLLFGRTLGCSQGCCSSIIPEFGISGLPSGAYVQNESSVRGMKQRHLAETALGMTWYIKCFLKTRHGANLISRSMSGQRHGSIGSNCLRHSSQAMPLIHRRIPCIISESA